MFDCRYWPKKLGSLLFCPDCGTLLSLPRDGESIVTCEQCGYEEPASCQWGLLTWIESKLNTFMGSIWESNYHNTLKCWSISITSTPEKKDADKDSWKRWSRDISKWQPLLRHNFIRVQVMDRWQRSALRVDTWRLIPKRCRCAFWSSKNREEMTCNCS